MSTTLKWVTGGLEILLGIPIFGGLIIVSTPWTALLFMLTLHIVALVFSVQEQTKTHGSILGIITSIVGFIPIVGMIMHLVTGAILLIDAATTD
jgi:predicted ABC-type exoprotein transport system permease subunit